MDVNITISAFSYTRLSTIIVAGPGLIFPESAFGNPLDWQRLEGKRACRIKFAIDGGGREDEDKWPEIQKVMVDSMIQLEKAFRPHIKKLKI